jgi:uncharacterized protein YdhG (YjbR/CyaY superfamily)
MLSEEKNNLKSQEKEMEKQKVQFSTVDEYIAIQPKKVRATLERLRQTIKKAAPGAEETISYGMPGYKFHGMLAWFAAAKNHYGLYIVPKFLAKFKDRLTAYETTKSTIRIPLDKPVPKKLVTEIIKYGAGENLKKAAFKKTVKVPKLKR